MHTGVEIYPTGKLLHSKLDEKKRFEMKVLILGSGSFAGQCYFEHLLKSGIEVHGVNRSKPKESEMWPWIRGVKMENIWHTYNIINDLDRIIEVINSLKPDTIIDFMGQGMVAQSWDDPALCYETNLGQKSKLINYLAKSDYLEQYIRASTPEVYGNEAVMIASSTFNPSTPYAISHAAIDTHLRCMKFVPISVQDSKICEFLWRWTAII